LAFSTKEKMFTYFSAIMGFWSFYRPFRPTKDSFFI
jgi:hypothetical protein